MTDQAEAHGRIKDMVEGAPVVLFMKGTKSFPQCGFSATVVQILSSLTDSFETVNVLSDPGIREGIKSYSDWPTIPQLYIDHEFVGGCDIIRDMFASGELQKKLGIEVGEIEPPAITITDAAKDVLRDALADADDGEMIHLSIDPKFQPDLAIAPKSAMSLVVEVDDLSIAVDLTSVERTRNIVVDFQESAMGAGFKIDNPNAPPEVVELNAGELKAKLDSGEIKHFFDVRTDEERATALIEAARKLDDDVMKEIEALDKDTAIAFHCHHGKRSRAAAEHFRDQGFKKVYNLAGGIDAWAAQVDTSLTRY